MRKVRALPLTLYNARNPSCNPSFLPYLWSKPDRSRHQVLARCADLLRVGESEATGRPRDRLAERAFRNPRTALAALLADLAAELDADLTAVHLVLVGEGVELLAAGGAEAATLGPPGRAAAPSSDLIEQAVADCAVEGASSILSEISPWSTHSDVNSACVILEGGHACLLTTAGGSKPELSQLIDASYSAAVLTQLEVQRRSIDRLRAELHEVQQDRSLMAATLQHDLRGPLTSIIGNVRTIQARSDQLDPKTAETLLDGVVMQSERLGRMLDETLDRSSGSLAGPVRQMQVSIKGLCERVVSAAVTARAGNVVIESDDFDITTDPDRLERALLNLVDNALKYSPLDVPVHLIVESSRGSLSITVADNGPGVSPEVLPGLFGAYATDPQRDDGIGLGLHSVSNVLEEIGGRVGYARHSGWTRFTITLPITQ